jgi:uncharacterized protein (TIGR02118 family)
MTVKVNVQYGKPSDPKHFEDYFVSTHAGIAKTLPGLRAFEYGKALANLDGSATDVFWIATLTFDSLDTVQAALASAEGQATTADMANYASGGATIVVSEVL